MTVPCPDYGHQLAKRADDLLPGLEAAERLELLGVMDPDDMRASLAWLASYAPQVFDFALVRDRDMVARLQTRLDDADLQEDLEPFCATCDGKVGIFRGHGDGWHHYRGDGTVASPVELYDAGHAPDVAWREAGGL